jgi:hypothetical protein
LLLFAAQEVNASQQWVKDDKMQFKIQIPSNYQKNRIVEDADGIHAFLSPDQNVAVRIRSFKVDNNATLDSVIKAFEQHIIVGAQKLLDDKYVLNSISGKICGYKWKFNNIPVGLAAFVTIQNKIAYIVWSIVPEQMFKQRTPETDAIINTFTVLGSNKSSATASVGIQNHKNSKGSSVGKKQNLPEMKKSAAKIPASKPDARFFDLVSDDAGLSHKVPVGFKLAEKEEGQSIWKNDAGIKMVIQTIARQGDLKDYINGLVSDIKSNGATVISSVFTVENGLIVANYVYEYGDSHFAYGATAGKDVYYLVGFVGKTADKALLNSYSEEVNMSLKR